MTLEIKEEDIWGVLWLVINLTTRQVINHLSKSIILG